MGLLIGKLIALGGAASGIGPRLYADIGNSGVEGEDEGGVPPPPQVTVFCRGNSWNLENVRNAAKF